MEDTLLDLPNWVGTDSVVDTGHQRQDTDQEAYTDYTVPVDMVRLKLNTMKNFVFIV